MLLSHEEEELPDVAHLARRSQLRVVPSDHQDDVRAGVAAVDVATELRRGGEAVGQGGPGVRE